MPHSHQMSSHQNPSVNMVKRYFLISTDHLEDKIWFHDDEDFKAAMNLVAVAAFVLGIKILDFTLMSNHVHFVVLSTRDEVGRFIDYFKMLFSKYYRKKYGVQKFLRGNVSDIREIEADGESLERGIAYVHMNCVAAIICVYPYQYRWGCGGQFFSQRPMEQGKCLGDLSFRAQYSLLHTKVKLPPSFRITPDGYIDPCSYIAIAQVERLFRTPKRFQYFLSQSSKARKRLSEEAMPSFRDQVILSSVNDLCKSLFRKECLEELTDDEQGELLRQLRYRFSADIAQLSRVTGIPYPRACSLIESFSNCS